MPLSVLFIFIFFLTLLGAVFFLPVTLVIQAFYQEKFVAKLHIRIFKRNIKTVQLYPKDKSKKRKKSRSDMDQRPGWVVFVKLPHLRKVETAFFVKCCVGMKGAASTAVATGVLQGIFNEILLIPENLTNLKTRQIEVVPSYDKPCFLFNGLCIARYKVGNIILGFIHYKKMKRK